MSDDDSQTKAKSGTRWDVEWLLPDATKRSKTFKTLRSAKLFDGFDAEVSSAREDGETIDLRAATSELHLMCKSWLASRPDLSPQVRRGYDNNWRLPADRDRRAWAPDDAAPRPPSYLRVIGEIGGCRHEIVQATTGHASIMVTAQADANLYDSEVTVIDPFHVVALAGAKLDLIRQRTQQQTLGRRGHTGDPLYGIRRIARTRTHLLSGRQHHRLQAVLDADEHIAVAVAWSIYQKIIAAYADPNRRTGKRAMAALMESIRRVVPAGLDEIAQLGRTLWRRRHDILAFFDHHASNGPTEAINGRLEALRRNALGFRNLTHYRIRSLLHSGALHALVNAL